MLFNRKILSLSGIALLAVMAIAGAHFLSASSTQSGNDLVCSFREAGLGNGNIDVVATADAAAVYACINGGDKNPKAANKRTVNATVSQNGTFKVKNGAASGDITLSAPSAGDFTCPSGQTLTLLSVTYSNVTITDTTNQVSTSAN